MPLGLLSAVPVSGRAAAPLKTVLAPPQGFRAAEGVVSAWLSGEGPFGATPKRRGGSAAQRAGLRYEKAALQHLANVFGREFIASQWFKFFNGHQLRWCQTDGLLIAGDTATIFECKVTFTADAWWQLRRLYEPVVQCVYQPKQVQLVVMCKNFDPLVSFPEPVEQIKLLDVWRTGGLPTMGVYSWKP